MPRPDLMQFCSKDETRWYLTKPFRLGEFTYASNGHLVVRVPAVDGDIAHDLSASNDAVRRWLSTETFDKILNAQPDATFAPLRVNLPPVKMRKCRDCNGSGRWDGDECETCNGDGMMEKSASVSVAGVPFALGYMAKIAALPNAEFPTNPIRDEPCPFRFTGGIGAIMEMREAGKSNLGNLDQFRVKP